MARAQPSQKARSLSIFRPRPESSRAETELITASEQNKVGLAKLCISGNIIRY